jgi:hypothetical protein
MEAESQAVLNALKSTASMMHLKKMAEALVIVYVHGRGLFRGMVVCKPRITF